MSEGAFFLNIKFERSKTMADTIKSGTILITEGALLPETILFESKPYAYGWRLVENIDSNGLDQIIRQAGWNFFYIASVIETFVFALVFAGLYLLANRNLWLPIPGMVSTTR